MAKSIPNKTNQVLVDNVSKDEEDLEEMIKGKSIHN